MTSTRISSVLTCLLLYLVLGCSQVATPPSPIQRTLYTKNGMIQLINDMPEYCIYEESKEAFINRLNQDSLYWVEQSDDGSVEYLRIEGDGCFGDRLFMISPQGEMFVLYDHWEMEAPGAKYDILFRHDTATNDLVTVRSDIPKSIFHADEIAQPLSQVWQSLQVYLPR